MNGVRFVFGGLMSQAAERLNVAIGAVPDLSSPSGNKWDPVYSVFADLLGLSKEQTYITYINKAANAQVRISKQMPTERPVRVALGICGTGGDWTSRSYEAQATRAIKSRRSLNCVIFLWSSSVSGAAVWDARVAFHRAGAPEAALVSAIWPEIQLVEVTGASATGQRDTIVDMDFTAAVINLLRRSKNVVLEGVPGTGKSFAVNDIVRRWTELTGRALAEPSVVVLHPSSSYEDLVEGLRPSSDSKWSDFTEYGGIATTNSGFVPQLGRFAASAARAAAEPERDHLLVLDELNRANVPRALGELLLVMEGSKRATHIGGSWSAPVDGVVRLTYTGTRFWVPDNLFILATMNTTDRSVAPLDAALRRRFVFKRLEPLSEDQLRHALPELEEDEQTMFDLVLEVWSAVNDDLLRPVIGPDAVLGHSFLFGLHSALSDTESSVDEVVDSFLRYTYLPQLIDAITTNGREAEVFDPSWARLDESSVAALVTLDALLELFGMRIALEGEGLSRRLSVVARGDKTVSDGDFPVVADEE